MFIWLFILQAITEFLPVSSSKILDLCFGAQKDMCIFAHFCSAFGAFWFFRRQIWLWVFNIKSLLILLGIGVCIPLWLYIFHSSNYVLTILLVIIGYIIKPHRKTFIYGIIMLLLVLVHFTGLAMGGVINMISSMYLMFILHKKKPYQIYFSFEHIIYLSFIPVAAMEMGLSRLGSYLVFFNSYNLHDSFKTSVLLSAFVNFGGGLMYHNALKQSFCTYRQAIIIPIIGYYSLRLIYKYLKYFLMGSNLLRIGLNILPFYVGVKTLCILGLKYTAKIIGLFISFMEKFPLYISLPTLIVVNVFLMNAIITMTIGSLCYGKVNVLGYVASVIGFIIFDLCLVFALKRKLKKPNNNRPIIVHPKLTFIKIDPNGWLLKLLLIIYRLIPFARWPVIITAMKYTPPKTYIVYSGLGAILWVLIFFIAGKYLL